MINAQKTLTLPSQKLTSAATQNYRPNGYGSLTRPLVPTHLLRPALSMWHHDNNDAEFEQ